MTSVVDTSVKLFSSTMEGAPVLSGTAGALLAVLDACLVSGFGAQVASSLSVSGGVATLTYAGVHAAVTDSVIAVSGSSIAALNGEQKVTEVGEGVVRFATAAGDGAATGTVSFKMAGAGWESPYTGTNRRAYRSLNPTSTRMLIRLDDTGTLAARVIGYEAMSGIDIGVGPFPLEANIAGGGHIAKSSVANTTAVKWYVIADSLGFILSISAYSASNQATWGAHVRYIGDILAARPGGDAYAFVLGYGTVGTYGNSSGTVDSPGPYHAFPRAYHGLGGSVSAACAPYTGLASSSSGTDTTLGVFPSEVDGGLRLSRRYYATPGTAPRGELPGTFSCPQSQVGLSIVSGSLQTGGGELAGRNLLALSSGVASTAVPASNVGPVFVDITGPWR